MTTTAFALLVQLCGLSQREAAETFEVRLDTVKSWSAGRNRAPDRILLQLATLASEIGYAAEEAAAVIAENMRKIEAAGRDPAEVPVELGLASDDTEAKSLGLPCVGAHRALLARVAAIAIRAGLTVEIVPRGSTAATAAAADAHRR